MKTNSWFCVALVCGMVVCCAVGWALDPVVAGEESSVSTSGPQPDADGSRTVAFLPGGHRLVVTDGLVVNVAAGGIRPWTLAQALTPAFRAAATASKLDRPAPVVIGLASPGRARRAPEAACR